MAILQRCLYVVPILFLLLGCSNKTVETRETIHARPEPFGVLTYLQGQDFTGSSQSRWYEIAPGLLNPIQDPASSQVVPYVPWTTARRIVGFVATGSAAIAGLNREGFLMFEETPSGDLALYKIDGGPAVEPYCSLAIMLVPSSELETDQNPGRSMPDQAAPVGTRSVPAMLVARDPYFGDLLNGDSSTAASEVPSPSVPDHPFVYLDWSDFLPHAVLPRAFGLGGSNIEALTRSSDGRWYMKVSHLNASARSASAGLESSKHYYAAPALNQEGASINRGDYQNGLNPQPFANMPRAVQSIMRAFTDSQRKKHYPILQLLKKDSFGLETFVADPGTKNTVPLSGGETEIVKFLGYADSEKALVILPDGRGVIGHSKLESFALPPLPEGFVYTGIVLINRWMIASWEEQESFAVGAAGFLVLPL